MYNWTWSWGLGLWAFFGVLFILAALAIPWALFLLNLRTLLLRVSRENRAMLPDYVWLNFIPVFNLYWFIYTVTKIRASLEAEYRARNWPSAGDFGYNVGLAAGVLSIASAFLGWTPLIGWGVSIGWLVCWIIYWMKTSDLKNQLGPRDTWFGSGSPGYPRADPTGRYWDSSGHTPAPYDPWQAPRPDDRAATGAYGAPTGSDQPSPESPGAESPGSASADQREKRCAFCGTTVAPDDKFCRGCGLPLGP
jgi:hypothetical protein